MEFSDQDRLLLAALQKDANRSLAELAQEAGMGTSTVWRKVQEFEAAGLIKGRVALLDPKGTGAGLCVFATVQLENHSEEAIRTFARILRSHPEIMEAHAISGTADYILKVRCKDVESYEAFMTHKLLRSEVVRSVNSAFSLKEMKYTTALPLLP